jgi:hypothetical protein
MSGWRELLQTGLLYTLLTLLVAGLSLPVGDWLLRYFLNLP